MDAQIAAAIKEERVRVARLGGKARADGLSAKRRQEIAKKASKAAARARAKKAKQNRPS
jgi:hypothetical protein